MKGIVFFSKMCPTNIAWYILVCKTLIVCRTSNDLETNERISSYKFSYLLTSNAILIHVHERQKKSFKIVLLSTTHLFTDRKFNSMSTLYTVLHGRLGFLPL